MKIYINEIFYNMHNVFHTVLPICISCLLNVPQHYTRAAVVVIVWSWIYNYLCNQCLSLLKL